MLERLYTTKMSSESKKLQMRFSKIHSKNGHASKIMAVIITLAISAAMLSASIVMAAMDSKKDERYIIEILNNSKIVPLENKPLFDGSVLYLPLEELLYKTGALTSGNAKIEYRNDIALINITEEVPGSYDRNKTNRSNYYFEIQSGRAECILNPIYTLPPEQQDLSFVIEMDNAPFVKKGILYVPFEYVRYMLNRFTQTYYISYSIWDTEYIARTDRAPDYTNESVHMDYFDNHKNLFTASEHLIKQHIGPPCKYRTISRGFDPSGGHNGADLDAAYGAIVKASTNGTVTEAGYNAEIGNYIIITDNDTLYGHAITTIYGSLGECFLEKGESVSKGDTLALVGNTGSSTGAHLHFEIKIDDTYYNPEYFC